jgi:hypothetical protein
MMTPTTTKMPELGNTGYIRQKIYDPYTQTYRSMAPVKANEWKDRQFSDIYNGASGGIVALAHGGMTGYADGGVTDQQVKDWFLANQGASDADITNAMGQFKVGTEQIARATGTMDQLGDYNTRFVQQVAQPNTTAEQFLAATSGAGIQNQALADALSNSGLSAAAQYAATHSDVGTGGGLAGLNEQINAALAANPNATLADAQAEMDKYGLTNADVLRATGQSTADIFAARDADAQAKALAEQNAAAAAAAKMSADQAAAQQAAAQQAAAQQAAAQKAAEDKAAADALAQAQADAISKQLADEAAAKAAAEKAAADKAAADAKAASEQDAINRAAAAKAIEDARLKKIAEEDAAAISKGAAAKAAYEKAEAEKAAAAAAAAAKKKAEEDAAAAAAAKAAADKAAADKIIADAAAAKKAAEDAAAAAAKAAADKAIADGKTAAEVAAAAAAAKLAAERALAEEAARLKAIADKKAADAAAAANVVTSAGTVNLGTSTGVTLDKTDTTSTGLNTLATTKPGGITSSVTTDGTYTGTSGTPAVVGTPVGQGKITGVGTETTTGTTGPIIDYGGASAFTTSPIKLAQTQIAEQAAATTAAQNKQLDQYRGFVTQNPNATDIEHANFLDKINLSPDVASKATPLSAQQMKNRYYDAKYNKMTGDSQSAYNFLMGKGAYPTKSGVGQIMRPYSEATLGMPASTNQKYVFDPATKSYQLNKDYVGSYRDSTGAVNYTMSPNEIFNYFKANQGQPDSVTYDWAIENNISPEEIAASTGVPLSTVAAKWRDAKAKKDATAKDATKTVAAGTNTVAVGGTNYDITDKTKQPPEDNNGQWTWDDATKKWAQYGKMAAGGIAGFAMGGMPMYAVGGGLGSLGSYSDGGRLLRGPGDGVSDSIPATIGRKQQPARLADGEFVVPARIVSELGNGSTEAGAKKLYAMMDRVQRARGKTTGKDKVAANSRADKHLPA